MDGVPGQPVNSKEQSPSAHLLKATPSFKPKRNSGYTSSLHLHSKEKPSLVIRNEKNQLGKYFSSNKLEKWSEKEEE